MDIHHAQELLSEVSKDLTHARHKYADLKRLHRYLSDMVGESTPPTHLESSSNGTHTFAVKHGMSQADVAEQALRLIGHPAHVLAIANKMIEIGYPSQEGAGQEGIS